MWNKIKKVFIFIISFLCSICTFFLLRRNSSDRRRNGNSINRNREIEDTLTRSETRIDDCQERIRNTETRIDECTEHLRNAEEILRRANNRNRKEE